MMVDTLPFLGHLLYAYLSPLDQLNLVRANISPTSYIQHHLNEFFNNVTGISWSTIRQLLESAKAQIGGQIVALFFSPVWYRPLGLDIIFDAQPLPSKNIAEALKEAFWEMTVPPDRYYLFNWSLRPAHWDTFNIVNKYHHVYPVTLIHLFYHWGTRNSMKTADCNFIKHDRAVRA